MLCLLIMIHHTLESKQQNEFTHQLFARSHTHHHSTFAISLGRPLSLFNFWDSNNHFLIARLKAFVSVLPCNPHPLSQPPSRCTSQPSFQPRFSLSNPEFEHSLLPAVWLLPVHLCQQLQNPSPKSKGQVTTQSQLFPPALQKQAA